MFFFSIGKRTTAPSCHMFRQPGSLWGGSFCNLSNPIWSPSPSPQSERQKSATYCNSALLCQPKLVAGKLYSAWNIRWSQFIWALVAATELNQLPILRWYLESLPADHVIVKLNFKNAETVCFWLRGSLFPSSFPLSTHATHFPRFYISFSKLILMSEDGVQQGDPLGPI